MTDGAQPSAPATGSPTFVSQQGQTEYQPQTPAAPAADPAPIAQPASAPEAPKEGQTPTIQQPEGEKPAEPAIAEPAKPADPDFKLPDEYKDKAWAAKVKSQDDLYKQIDNLTALVGKKAVVPDLKTASPEDREAFYAQLRGKDAAEYVIPENPAFPTPAETQPAVAKLFMDNGVSPVQAESIIKGYQELGAKQLAEQFNPDGFKAAMETAFGPDGMSVAGQVRNTIKSMMSDADFKTLDAIPNNLLGTVYRTLGNTITAVNETLKKYGATESFAHIKAPAGGVAATDLTSLRQDYRNQLSALSMRPHTSAEVADITQKLADTYKNDPRLNNA